MSDLMEMLIKHELDVVLSYKPSQHYAQIESHYLFDNELCVVVSDTHPLAAHKSVELADLTLHRMALPAPGLQARNKFDTLIRGTQYDFNVCLEINDVNALISLVRDSRLVTVLSTAPFLRWKVSRRCPLWAWTAAKWKAATTSCAAVIAKWRHENSCVSSRKASLTAWPR